MGSNADTVRDRANDTSGSAGSADDEFGAEWDSSKVNSSLLAARDLDRPCLAKQGIQPVILNSSYTA